MRDVAKWAFGMAPFKQGTNKSNADAIMALENFLKNDDIPYETTLDAISRVKGMFNRIIRQDQWDWMTTAAYMNFPSRKEIKVIVAALNDLKGKIKTGDTFAIQKSKERLALSGIDKRFEFYVTYNPTKGRPGQYIYVLSRREERDVLKIGMTTRDVLVRAKEINSATGMLYPLGVRNVFAVTDAAAAEKAVHLMLAKFRIRQDREFFRIPFKDACEKIEECLADNGFLK